MIQWGQSWHISKIAQRYPNFVRMLNKWMWDTLDTSPKAKFRSTSLAFNENFRSARHRDVNNSGASLAASLGQFTGGAFCVSSLSFCVLGFSPPCHLGLLTGGRCHC